MDKQTGACLILLYMGRRVLCSSGLSGLILLAGCLPRVSGPAQEILAALQNLGPGGRPETASSPAALYAGGSVYGENPSGLSLSLTGGSSCGSGTPQTLLPVATGTYQFSGALPDGCTGALVGVTAQPTGIYCTPYNTTVTITGSSVTNIDVYCFAIDAPAGPLSVTEGGTTQANIRLTASPGPSSVSIDFASSVTSAITSTATLTFNSSNYNSYQQITLSGVGDANVSTETSVISFSTSAHSLGTFNATTVDTTGGSSARFIYATSGTHTGDFATDGSLTGSNWVQKADYYCSLSANQPAAIIGSGNYRALLTAASDRIGTSGSQSYWPLRSGISYYASNGTTLVATADASNIFSTISNTLPSGGNYWTGIGNSVTWAPGSHCSTWADGTSGSSGHFGLGTFTSGVFISYLTTTCDTPKQLLCVQDLKDMGNGTISSALQNLRWMKCSAGQTWDSGTNSCTGTAAFLRYCDGQNNTCNGGTSSGSLDGGGTSDIYSACAAETLAGRTWRVPLMSELAELRLVYNYTSSLFPGTMTGYYWSSNSFSNTQAYGVYFNTGTLGAIAKDNSTSAYLRCVSDGL